MGRLKMERSWSNALGALKRFWLLSDAHLVKKFRDRDEFCDSGTDCLARHIIAMEEFRRLSFVRSLLLASRADLLRVSPLSSNKMQSFRANDPALQDYVWRL